MNLCGPIFYRLRFWNYAVLFLFVCQQGLRMYHQRTCPFAINKLLLNLSNVAWKIYESESGGRYECSEALQKLYTFVQLQLWAQEG